jgi:hypothetical protein
VSDIDTAVVDSLKALDPERPIREADIAAQLHVYSFTPCRRSVQRDLVKYIIVVWSMMA